MSCSKTASVPPHRLVLDFAPATRVCVTDDIVRVDHLCEALKAFLRARCNAFVLERQGEPIAEIYSSDATPLVCISRYTSHYGDLAVQRRGRNSAEWLIEKLFLLDTRGGKVALISEPRLLGDKTAWAHYQAQQEFWPLARERGHTDIIISHHMWDRAVKAPCERHQRQRHAALSLALQSHMSEGEAIWTDLCSWFTCTGCVAHDVHNALKWSVFSLINDRSTVKSCWVVLESLRNGYNLLVQEMGQWIADKIEFSDHANLDVLRRLWLLMGLTDEWVTLFVDVQLRWENGRLCVGEKWRAEPTTPQAVTTCLMHVWAFRSFSDSRWCSLGAGCRSLVSSLMVGLADLAQNIILNPRCSNYYIGGFSNLSKDVIRMCTLISCSGHISDSILLMVLEDDRIP